MAKAANPFAKINAAKAAKAGAKATKPGNPFAKGAKLGKAAKGK